MAPIPQLANVPAGSTVTPISGGRRIIYPTKAERLVLNFTPRPDLRDERIALLTTALQHIRTLASDAPSLAMNMTDGDIFDAIALLAVDALAGEAAPTATVYEELAI